MRISIILLAASLICPAALAQASESGGRTKSSVLSTGGGQALLDPSDTVILFLDHQSGLFQTVKDIAVGSLPCKSRRGRASHGTHGRAANGGGGTSPLPASRLEAMRQTAIFFIQSGHSGQLDARASSIKD